MPAFRNLLVVSAVLAVAPMQAAEAPTKSVEQFLGRYCSECHDDQAKGTLKAIPVFSHTPIFVKNHRFFAATDDRLCATCHKASFCADCHTNQVEMKPSVKYGNRPDREMPHRGNFLTLHKIEGKLDPASCYRCHGRANNERCVACHH